MKILITAFEPFGGGTRNASLEILHALPKTHCGAELHTMELPVIYDRCGEMLREAAGTLKPDAVLCLGQAEGRSAVTPESTAFNLDDSQAKDNAGQIRQSTPILKGAADSYPTGLPAQEMVSAMAAKGIPAELSHSAGRYVCNNLMFHAVRYGAEAGIRAGFIHVPISWDNGRGTPFLPGETLLDAILTAIEVLVKTAPET